MTEKNRKKALAIGASCVAMIALMGMMPGGGGMGGGGMPGGMGEGEDVATTTVVNVQNPTLGNIVVTSSFVGTVEPGQQVTVYPKTAGEVVSVNYSVGDTVQAGATLFTLDSTNQQLSIAQAQANIASSEARAQLNLESAQQDLETYYANIEEGYNSSLLQAENTVRNAELALQQANNSYRVARQNYYDYISGSSSDDDYSTTQRDSLRNTMVNAELSVESAQQALENAQISLEAAQKSVEEQAYSVENSVRSAELNADFTADYLSIQQLQNSLKDYTVTSTITGIIEQRDIDPGDMVSSQTQAFIISNKEAMTVSFSVTENALSYMNVGDSITVEKDGETTQGILSEISTMVDASSGLYNVKATVSGAPFELHSGSTVKLYADTQKVEGEILIPIDAVYHDNGTPYVYVFEDNTALKRTVETGISDEENIQIISGLSLSDDVIVTWSSNLYDGAEVYLPGTAPAASSEAEEAPEGFDPALGSSEGAPQPGEGFALPGDGELSDGDEGSPAGEMPGEGGEALAGFTPGEVGEPEAAPDEEDAA